MIDPVTALAGASAAFQMLKKGIAVGKDLQDMGGQLSKWAGSIADLDFAEKQNQKPAWYKTLGGGVQAQAMEIFAAKQKAASMRQELKEYISVMYGPSKWQEILAIEADLRKQKREHEHRQMEIKQAIIEWATGIAVFLLGLGAIFGFVWIGTR
tara:strand:- start:7847 stop:8308 length:462 start_codon:yes stop_codon:yes gene_type:complete